MNADGLVASEGESVTHIDVLADPEWWIEGTETASLGLRVVQTNSSAPRAFLDVLQQYISPDDAGLSTRERLRLVAGRIASDISE